MLLDIQRLLLLCWKVITYNLVPIGWIMRRSSVVRRRYAIRLRRAVQELGVPYLKLGQFLALRPDILPREVTSELEHLFDKVAPISLERAKTIFRRELGISVEEVFATFDPAPIAAGSIAQVHTATTHSHKRVAVKLQRPGIERLFRADIRNFRRIAWVIDFLGLVGNLSAKSLVDEFAKWTMLEMDFMVEGERAEKLRARALPFEVIPWIDWDLTTPKVLTMQYIDGISAARLRELLTAGGMDLVHHYLPNLDLNVALERFGVISLRQLLVTGHFHGDPHPGNVFFRDDSTVAFVDFGICGYVTSVEREVLAGQIESLAIGDLNASLRYYSRQLVPRTETDLEAFRRQALALLNRWYHTTSDPSTPVEERVLVRLSSEMVDIARRNGLQYGRNYLLFWRALNIFNATALSVNPGYPMMSELRRFFRRYRPDLVQRFSRLTVDARWQHAVAESVLVLPKHVSPLITRLRGGQVTARTTTRGSSQHKRTAPETTALLGLIGVSNAVLLLSQHFSPILPILGVGFAVVLAARTSRRRG